MNSKGYINVAWVVGVIVLVGSVAAFKNQGDRTGSEIPTAQAAAVPRLLEIGAGKCIDCQKMAALIKELEEEYRGKVVFESIDVMVDGSAQRTYEVRIIPTQIFYDRAGVEVWRHEGFLPREEVVAKLTELGA